jgi:transcriptional regulator of heat shock response
MVRVIDHKERQEQILALMVKCYVETGKPVSSDCLREAYDLPYSPATIRNTLVELEDLGYICHVHTSSGRVPTQEGFRYYIQYLMKETASRDETVKEVRCAVDTQQWANHGLDEVIDCSSKLISNLTHQAGFGFNAEHRDKMFVSGTRFIFEQPEFEDIATLKNLFTALEEKVTDLWDFLDERVEDEVKVFIGDEISVLNTKSCAMIVAPFESEGETRAMIGVLGPMRMKYSDVIAKLNALRDRVRYRAVRA